MTDTPTNASDIAVQLAALNAQFAAQLGATLDQLNALVTNQPASREVLQELHARLHKLAGSGGTFGFAELSRQASALEVGIKIWLDANTAPTPAEWQTWQTALQALHQATRTPATNPMTQTPVIKVVVPANAVHVVLIEDDLEFTSVLTLGLQQFGYVVSHYTGFGSAAPAILANPPDVIVVDIMLPGQNPSDGTQAIDPLFERLGRRLPTIFITARTDFLAKLAVSFAKGDAFLVKPVDAPTLAARIELLMQERQLTPYRVLIVDDDEVLAEHYRLTLTGAGMLAEKVCQPQDVLAAMQLLSPDLILMDLCMPGYSGADLARAIRYDAAWQGLPIVFLSAEADLDTQIEAMSSGADDFLTKPISPERLVGSVRSRARRARQVSELMSQDSLTGLLKHASIKDRLAQEVDRAKRQGTVLSVAMVDIDFFKKVNDTWGHPVGDQVIKTLGHLLRQRLRRQDSVGRYGGEEFLAILPECSLDNAQHLLDDIRHRFSEVHFLHQGQNFSVTLSAGIASSTDYNDAPSLLAAADGALYVAKHGGRNQVRPAKVNQETAK